MPVNGVLSPEVLDRYPQLLPKRTVVLVTDDGRGFVVAEFHGPRVDDIRPLRRELTSLTGMPIVLVRDGWLPVRSDGAVDTAIALHKLQEMLRRRESVKAIEDGTFSVLPDADKDCFDYFGSFAKLRTPVELTYPAHVTVGNWVSLGRYGKIVMLPGELFEHTGEAFVRQHYPDLVGTFDFNGHADNRPATLHFGDGTTLGDRFFIICTTAVEFGHHVMAASNVFVSDCHHIYEHTEIPPALLPVTAGRPVKIEDHVWIGINCCILEGVTVGRHAVIAANSVVKEDVPPYSLVAGSPARVKKTFRPGEHRTF